MSQVFLAIYDTTVSPSTYTGSENIDITNNEISLNFLLTINDELFLNPRVNGYFEIYSAPNCISFLQHNSDGSQPRAVFNSLDKSVEFFGDVDIQNHYNKTEVDSLLANINLSDYCNRTEMDLIVSNIDLSNYYTKTEIDDIDNELSTLILNTYTKPGSIHCYLFQVHKLFQPYHLLILNWD